MKRIWTPTPEHYKAQTWCINNEIKVYPKPFKGQYYFVYVIDGVGKNGRKMYNKEEMEKTWWDFYLYLYRKYKDG